MKAAWASSNRINVAVKWIMEEQRTKRREGETCPGEASSLLLTLLFLQCTCLLDHGVRFVFFYYLFLFPTRWVAMGGTRSHTQTLHCLAAPTIVKLIWNDLQSRMRGSSQKQMCHACRDTPKKTWSCDCCQRCYNKILSHGCEYLCTYWNYTQIGFRISL